MNNVDAWDGLIGVLIPFAVALLVRKSWDGWIKGLVMIGLSLVIAAIKVAFSGDFDVTGSHLAQTFVAIAVASQVSYEAVTKEWAKQLQNFGNKDATPTAAEIHQSISTDF